MSGPGLFLAICTLLLTADGLARSVPAVEPAPQPACRFTLERSAEETAETWLLTCHRGTAPMPVAGAVTRQRVVRPSLATSSG